MIERNLPPSGGNGDSITQEVLRVTHVLSHAIREILEQRYLREIAEASLSISQIHLLKLISLHGDHFVGEIATFLGVSAPAASKNVDKLAKLDLLRREIPERDRRNTSLKITEKGEALVREYEARRIAALESVLKTFTDEEKETFSRLLEKFVVGLIEREKIDSRSCLRCGAFYESECPVRGVTGQCPYERARKIAEL